MTKLQFKTMLAQAEAIAAYMAPGSWAARAMHPNHDEPGKVNAILQRRSDGLMLGLSCWGYDSIHATKPGALSVCIYVNDNPTKGLRSFRDVSPSYREAHGYNAKSPSANMSAAKAPRALAREIMRRIVTPNEGHIASMFARLQEEADNTNAVAAMFQRIADAGLPIREHYRTKDERTVEFGGLRVEISQHGSMRLDGHMNYLDEERLVAIFELFQSRGWKDRP